MKKIVLGVCFALLAITFSHSQQRHNYYSNIWWNELNIKGKLNSKFFYQIDFQYRTGSDANNKSGSKSSNPFYNTVQLNFRPFLGYQINDNLQFMLAPGIAPTWNGYRKDVGEYSLEYRLTPQFILNQKIGRVALTHRYRFEMRWFGKSVHSTNSPSQSFDSETFTYDETKSKYRFRYMFRAICPLNNSKIEKGTFYVNFFDEVHVNLGANVPSTQQVDQNRINLGLGYRMGRDIRFEIGPFVQTAFAGTSTGTNVFNNHGVQFFIIINDLKKLFKGDETPTPVVAPAPVEEKK